MAGTFAAFDSDAVEWLGAAPNTYRSSDFAFRRFCAACGSQLAFGFDERPEEQIIGVGTLDRADEVAANRHIFLSQKISWLRLDEHLPGRPRWWNPPSGQE